jgi:hypothetical protein
MTIASGASSTSRWPLCRRQLSDSRRAIVVPPLDDGGEGVVQDVVPSLDGVGGDGRPGLEANSRAWPLASRWSTRCSSSLKTSARSQWSNEAKNSPSRRSQPKPIIVERVTPAAASNGAAHPRTASLDRRPERAHQRADPVPDPGPWRPRSAERGSWPSRRRGRRPSGRSGRGARGWSSCRRPSGRRSMVTTVEPWWAPRGGAPGRPT